MSTCCWSRNERHRYSASRFTFSRRRGPRIVIGKIDSLLVSKNAKKSTYLEDQPREVLIFLRESSIHAALL